MRNKGNFISIDENRCAGGWSQCAAIWWVWQRKFCQLWWYEANFKATLVNWPNSRTSERLHDFFQCTEKGVSVNAGHIIDCHVLSIIFSTPYMKSFHIQCFKSAINDAVYESVYKQCGGRLSIMMLFCRQKSIAETYKCELWLSKIRSTGSWGGDFICCEKCRRKRRKSSSLIQLLPSATHFELGVTYWWKLSLTICVWIIHTKMPRTGNWLNYFLGK